VVVVDGDGVETASADAFGEADQLDD